MATALTDDNIMEVPSGCSSLESINVTPSTEIYRLSHYDSNFVLDIYNNTSSNTIINPILTNNAKPNDNFNSHVGFVESNLSTTPIWIKRQNT